MKLGKILLWTAVLCCFLSLASCDDKDGNKNDTTIETEAETTNTQQTEKETEAENEKETKVDTETDTVPADPCANGHTEAITPAVAATCTETGLTEGKHCSVCNTVLVAQNTTDAKGHLPVIDNAAQPTCTNLGLTSGAHCSTCGTIIIKQEIIPATGHHEITDNAVAPTCTETGLTEGKHCSVCKVILVPQSPIAATGHSEVTDTAVEPTCTETGLTEGKHCSVCNTTLVAQTTVAAKGHTEVIDKAVAPTCTETGLSEGKHCSVCSTVLVAQTTVAAKGHTEVIDKAVAATCTETGLTEGKHCSACSTILKAQTETPTIAHSYDSKYDESCNVCGFIRDAECAHINTTTIAGVGATCTTTGLTTGTKCAKCGEILVAQQIIPEKGHTEVIDKAVAPTCTETGLSEGKHCSVCSTVLAAQTTVAAKGHAEVIDKAVAATCTETGLTEGKHCSVCETVFVEQTTVAATGHNEVIDKAVAPTCTKTGLSEGKHCSVCNTVIVLQTSVPMLDHTYTNTYDTSCNICGFIRELAIHCPNCYGEDVDYVGNVVADCLNSGGDVYLCNKCEKNFITNFVEPLGHDYSVKVKDAVDGDGVCGGKNGTTAVMKCSRCDATTGGVATEKTEHTWGVWTTVVPAVCGVSNGVSRRTCKNCSVFEEMSIVADTHKLVHNTARDEKVDCKNSGEIDGHIWLECANCDYEKKVVARDYPHSDEYYNGGVVTTKPLCGVDGVLTFTCADCGATRTEVIPALTYNRDAGDITTPATCTVMGKTTYKCTVDGCTATTTEQDVPVIAHTLVYHKAVADTCVTFGNIEYWECSVCNKIFADKDAKTEITDTVDNKYDCHNHQVNDLIARDATCVLYGYVYYACTVCGDDYIVTYRPLGHSYTVEKSYIAPTYTTKGERVWECANKCGKTKTDVIDALKGINFVMECYNGDDNGIYIGNNQVYIVNDGIVAVKVYLQAWEEAATNLKLTFNYKAADLTFIGASDTGIFDHTIVAGKGGVLTVYSYNDDSSNETIKTQGEGAKVEYVTLYFGIDISDDKFSDETHSYYNTMFTNFASEAYKVSADKTFPTTTVPHADEGIRVYKQGGNYLGLSNGDSNIDDGFGPIITG